MSAQASRGQKKKRRQDMLTSDEVTSVRLRIIIAFDWWFAISVFISTTVIDISTIETITSGINFIPAMFVFTTDLIFTLVNKTSVSRIKIGFAIQVGSTLNINTFVFFLETAADLFVTTVYSVQTFNIDTLIVPTT